MKYGLDNKDLKFCRDKIDAQKSYLSNNFFNTSTGQVKSLLDISFSANMSERYYAQLSNKINTMSDLAKSQNLKPVFLTITLDGFFRDFLKNDFSRWDKKTGEEKTEYLRHIPNDEARGFLRAKIRDRIKFSIKDCYNVLTFQWYHYASGYAFKKLKREGKRAIYVRACEPHQDGVPHFHVLLWIPQNYFKEFQKDFVRYFPAPQNHKPLEGGNEGDTKGFQTVIYNPVGYVMKYATKSFMDLRTGEDLNYLQAWYIKHKIRRITTSQSTIPQWVYQKVFALEKDWYHLTDIVAREPLLCEWNREENFFCLIEDNGRTLEYDDGLLTLRYLGSDRSIQQLGEKKERLQLLVRTIKLPVVSLRTKDKFTPSIPVYIDGQKFVWNYKKELIKPIPQPLKMKDAQLLSYFHFLDPQIVTPAHFLHTREVCIERGLVEGELRPKTVLYDPEIAQYYFNSNWGSEYVF